MKNTPPSHRAAGNVMIRSALARTAFAFGLTLLWVPPASSACAEPPHLLQVELPQGHLVGMPVHWGKVDAALLETNGHFHLFDVADVREHRLLNQAFRPQSLSEARAQLQAELGPGFEIQITGPYVIATPVGGSKSWQARFNALLSGYTRYFEVRGWPLRQPDFPLVVIVFQTREEFRRYSAAQTNQLPNQAVGSYFPLSNRCVLYQIPDSRGTNWAETEATIVHEAVHQLAYNTGVHERLFENPVWFVEGLATMFEQPAVYDSSVSRSTIVSRMNAQKVANLQPILRDPQQLESHIGNLIVSDQLFRSDPFTAYTVSWAMTFYLAERMPTEYRSFIKLQSLRPFGAYDAAQRHRDFQTAFKTAPNLLSNQMIRLLQN